MLGPSWGRLGATWCRLGPTLGPSLATLGPSWAHLGAILGPSGAILGPTLAIWCRLEAILAQIAPKLKNLNFSVVFSPFLNPQRPQKRPIWPQLRPPMPFLELKEATLGAQDAPMDRFWST